MLAILELLDSWKTKALWCFGRLRPTHPTTQHHISQELNPVVKSMWNLTAMLKHENSFTKCQTANTLFYNSYLFARQRFFWQYCWEFEFSGMWCCVKWVSPAFLQVKGVKKSQKVQRDHDPSKCWEPVMHLHSVARPSTTWIVRWNRRLEKLVLFLT